MTAAMANAICIFALGMMAAEMILLLGMFCLLLEPYGIRELRRKRQGRKREKDAPEKPAADTPEKPKHGSMDEGFENIMQYAVNGKTGFEPGRDRF